MYGTLVVRRVSHWQAKALAAAAGPTTTEKVLQIIKPEKVPSLETGSGNLYELLSRTPNGGAGQDFYQMRWTQKDIHNSFWKVTRSKFKDEGKHGRAWGKLYWKGKLVTPKETRIKGTLKYRWASGRSTGFVPNFDDMESPELVTEASAEAPKVDKEGLEESTDALGAPERRVEL